MPYVHDVHSTQLTPHLNAHAEDDTLDDTRLGESGERCLSLLALERQCLFDLLVLGQDLGVVHIAAAV